MKIVIFTICSLLVLLLVFSCKTTKYSPTDFPDQQITFGSGGGFSGIVTDYTLLSNGQLFKRSSTDNRFVELKSIKKQAAKQAIKNYTFLGINEVVHDAPGNLYYFINYKDSDKVERKIVWGNKENPIDEKVKSYYKILTSFLKDNLEAK